MLNATQILLSHQMRFQSTKLVAHIQFLICCASLIQLVKIYSHHVVLSQLIANWLFEVFPGEFHVMQRQAHFNHLANQVCIKTASTKVLTVETQQHCNKNQLCNDDNVVNHLCYIHWDMISMFKKLVLKWNWTHQNFNLQVESEVLLVWLKG